MAKGEPQSVWSPGRIRAVAVGVGALETAFIALVVLSSGYLKDDYLFFDVARKGGFSGSELTRSVFGSLIPGFELGFSTLASLHPIPRWPAELTTIVLYALALAVLFRLLVLLVGYRPMVLALLAIAGLSGVLGTSLSWWTASLNALPVVACDLLALDGVARHAATGKARHLIVAVVAFAVGVAFYDASSSFVLVLVVFVALFLADQSGWRSMARALVARTWLWVGLAVPIVVDVIWRETHASLYALPPLPTVWEALQIPRGGMGPGLRAGDAGLHLCRRTPKRGPGPGGPGHPNRGRRVYWLDHCHQAIGMARVGCLRCGIPRDRIHRGHRPRDLRHDLCLEHRLLDLDALLAGGVVGAGPSPGERVGTSQGAPRHTGGPRAGENVAAFWRHRYRGTVGARRSDLHLEQPRPITGGGKPGLHGESDEDLEQGGRCRCQAVHLGHRCARLRDHPGPYPVQPSLGHRWFGQPTSLRCPLGPGVARLARWVLGPSPAQRGEPEPSSRMPGLPAAPGWTVWRSGAAQRQSGSLCLQWSRQATGSSGWPTRTQAGLSRPSMARRSCSVGAMARCSFLIRRGSGRRS